MIFACWGDKIFTKKTVKMSRHRALSIDDDDYSDDYNDEYGSSYEGSYGASPSMCMCLLQVVQLMFSHSSTTNNSTVYVQQEQRQQN